MSTRSTLPYLEKRRSNSDWRVSYSKFPTNIGLILTNLYQISIKNLHKPKISINSREETEEYSSFSCFYFYFLFFEKGFFLVFCFHIFYFFFVYVYTYSTKFKKPFSHSPVCFFLGKQTDGNVSTLLRVKKNNETLEREREREYLKCVDWIRLRETKP